MARSSVSRTSPTLPPNATNASATVLAVAHDGDPDIGEGGRDRRMRLVHGHLHAGDLREPAEHGFGDLAGRGLDQSMPTGAERDSRDIDDLVIADGIREFVRAGRRAQVDV